MRVSRFVCDEYEDFEGALSPDSHVIMRAPSRSKKDIAKEIKVKLRELAELVDLLSED